MTEISTSMPSYPMLALVVRHGGWASTLAAVVVGLAGVLLGYALTSPLLALGGLCAAAVAFIVARTLVELVRLITDMLLPK